MKKFILFVLVLVCLFSLNGCGNDDVSIPIKIPAGNTEEFVYSEQEISPYKDKLEISAGNGLGDTMVFLKPVECKEENAYEPTYLAPGVDIKIPVEKHAWFKIGVSVPNPTDEDITVYVNLKDVQVRIQ